MEFLLFLLYPAGLLSIVAGLATFLRSNTGQRALKISRANRSDPDDLETGFAAVSASMKQLRQAKTEENQLHIDTWEQQFYTEEEYKALIAKRQHEKMLEEGTIKAKMLTPTETKHISAVDREADEWVPLGYTRKHDPDEELTFSQRRIQRAGAFIRTTPHDQSVSLGAVVGGSVINLDGWVKGKSIAGNNVWFYFVGRGGTKKYIWSGATTNRSTSGMPCDGDFYSYEPPSLASHIQLPVAEVARRTAQQAKWTGSRYLR